MNKVVLILITAFLSGCYSAPGMWFRANFSFSCPNKYEKEIIRDSCNVESIRLKLEEHIWEEGKLADTLCRMNEQVYAERLYINKIVIVGWRGDTAIVIFASNIPTSLADKDEKEKHNYHKLRDEKCDCRLCR